MKNGYVLLTVFLIIMNMIPSAFALDSLSTGSIQKDSTKLLNPDRKLLLDSLNLNIPKILPYHFQVPKKYPDSKMSLGPADNDVDPKMTIAPADNSMDSKISIPLNYAPGPFYRKFDEKRDFRFPKIFPKSK